MSMPNVRSEPISIFTPEDWEPSIFRCNTSTSEAIDNAEHDLFSQPWVNSSAATASAEECSQVPPSIHGVFSPQPSPEFLASLGIRVRDFAYENTLPAIVPVPRVPRQVQPAPQTLKRSQREWDKEEESLQNSSLFRSLSGRTPPKKSRSLERKPTEPLDEAAIQYTRTLERIAFNRMFSIITSPTRRTPSPPTPRMPITTSPPTLPLTPPLSYIASQDSELVQTPSTFPFAVRLDTTNRIPARQLDPALQAVSIHPVLFSSFALDSQSPPVLSSPTCSPLHLPDVSPAQLIDPFLEPPALIKESGRGRRTRKSRADETACTTSPPNRYQLRKRSIVSSHTAISSRRSRPQTRTSKSLPRRK